MRSYLIVKTSALGDIIQTFAAAEYLATKGAVDWVVEERFAPTLVAHPSVRRVIPVKTRQWRSNPLSSDMREALGRLRAEKYDALFDLQGNCKSGLYTLCARAKEKVGLSLGSLAEWPNALVTRYRYFIDPKTPAASGYLELVQRHFGDNEPFTPPYAPLAHAEEIYLDLPSPRYMVCLGSNWENKRLSFETVQAFLEEVEGHFVFIYGSGAERVFAEKCKRAFPKRSIVAGGLSIPEWQALMRRTDGVIAVDSSGLHLAAAAGIPTFSLFGPSSGPVYAPAGPRHAHVQGSCPYRQTFTKRCPLLRTCKTGACMKELDPFAIVHAFRQWEATLRNQSKPQSRCDFVPH